MTSKKLHRFVVSGELASDVYMAQTRDGLRHKIVTLMRDEGYVPSLDEHEEYVIHLNEGGRYEFELAIWGVYVGKVKSWRYTGWSRGQMLPGPIPQSRLDQ